MLDDVIERVGYTALMKRKDKFGGDLPTLSMAIFPQEFYTGTFTKDLLVSGSNRYFWMMLSSLKTCKNRCC